ncbi:hypothetical protein QQP08_005465 [Theobroma cacao]|nr:hypothetical protein QQP08_005465 [Theobroma cacao]
MEDITTRNETALHIAVQNKRLDTLEPLRTFRDNSKALGIEVLNKKNNDGNTTLHLASLNNQP